MDRARLGGAPAAATSVLGRGGMATFDGRGPRDGDGGAGSGVAASGGEPPARQPPLARCGGRAAALFRPSARRASSLTTAERPIRIRPPVSAVAPADIRVGPRANSLSGIPNPIATTPDAATTIPKISSSTDIRFYAPRPHATAQRQPRCYGYQIILALFCPICNN